MRYQNAGSRARGRVQVLSLRAVLWRTKEFYTRYPRIAFILLIIFGACFYGGHVSPGDKRRDKTSTVLHVITQSSSAEDHLSTTFFQEYRAGLSQGLTSSDSSSNSSLGSLTASSYHDLSDTLSHVASLRVAPSLDAGSLTAILPIASAETDSLNAVLLPMLDDETSLRTVILICPNEILSTLLQTVSNNFDASLQDLHVIPWMKGVSEEEAIIKAASLATTDLLLILCDEGFSRMTSEVQDALLNPVFTDIPMGPCGILLTPSELRCSRSTTPKRAAFLVPPFIVPTDLINAFHFDYGLKLWEAFGASISTDQFDGAGGLILASNELNEGICLKSCHNLKHEESHNPAYPSRSGSTSEMILELESPLRGRFSTKSSNTISSLSIILRSFHNLQEFSHAICRFYTQGIKPYIILLGSSEQDGVSYPKVDASEDRFLELETQHCLISYTFIPHSINPMEIGEAICSKFKTNEVKSLVAILSDDRTSYEYVQESLRLLCHIASTLIKLPEAHLAHSEWVGSLNLIELQNWHVPRLQISIVTNNRPKSLSRLLISLEKALYFGDVVDTKINMEQTADKETILMTGTFRWEHGHLSISHRIIHGGLLPAVVESWYPATNNSYGLILEDDVEVSPLFYAWIKMSLLHYRYGANEDKSQSLFGISLYQQKNIELRPEGRRPFDARAVFDAYGMRSANTPYLSQIPCSWGAVYFPEHWEEFHSFLTIRFSEKYMPITQDIVPNARSNKWTKSWKKYFIELVYLRGYVMLYPNYDSFASLSTNHLEVGSHVKDQPYDIYSQKKSLFELPLINLTRLSSDSTAVHLLDLPEERMPDWSELPILDLFGLIATAEDIHSEGEARRRQLAKCSLDIDHKRTAFDANTLFSCNTYHDF